MEQVAHYIRIVEEAIAQLGIDPAKVRTQQPGTWALTKGSAQVFAQVFVIAEEQKIYFQVNAPVMDWPESSEEALAKDLLALNYQIIGASFCLFEGKIVLKVVREAQGMDAMEALALIGRIGHYADMFDDQLKEKYPFRLPVGFNTFRPKKEESEKEEGNDKEKKE